MLLDFQSYSADTELHADICVVGSGAAGIALAVELNNTGLEVVVLAGGDDRFDAACQELYQSRTVGLPHEGIHQGRSRIHGGTTTLWAGQALPLDPIDFEPRDWVPLSGWPIGLETLAPYYPRAEKIMKLAPLTYDESAWPPNMERLPPFDPTQLFPRISQFAQVPNFAVSYKRDLEQSRNVKVLLNAHAVELRTNEAGSYMERVVVRSLNGVSNSVRGRYVVVCCGAIETARLLLASNRLDARGVGNGHDLVGRCFQDHLQALVAPIRSRNVRQLRRQFLVHTHRGTRYSPRVCASKAFQKKHRILNICGGLTHKCSEDGPVESAKLLARSVWRKELRAKAPRALFNALRNPLEVARASAAFALYRTPMVSSGGPLYLGLQSEQSPNLESRVTLGTEPDALGMPRSVLDWRLTELDRRTVSTFATLMSAEFRRLGLCEIDVQEFVRPSDAAPFDRRVFDCNHHIGTARMNDDPKLGVVDRHCRVHGIENLFIGSSAVFPTGGSSNPTLTIIALCLRMADHLRSEFRQASAPAAIHPRSSDSAR